MLCNICKDLGLHFDEVFPRHKRDTSAEGWSQESSDHHSGSKKSKKAKIHPGYKHHDSFANIIRAGREGCELCALLELAVTVQITDLDTKPKDSLILSMLIHNTTPMYIRAPWPFVGSVGSLRCTFPGFNQAGMVDAKIRVFCEPNDPAALTQVSGRPIYSRVSSDRVYSFATSQIQNCKERHGKACSFSVDSALPTRVIDVSCQDGTQDPFILESKGKAGVWIALSHQWGGKIPQRTTTDNIASRCQKLTSMELPLTFQDAIQITRGLGCRYLWIDALCIIQDSHDDWVFESQQMDRVYKDAYLTIACDMVENSESGILPRDPKPSVQVTVPYESRARDIKGVFSISLPTKYSAPGPLFSRGWTLQEDLLSTRLLHFDAEQLLWTCRSMATSEENSTVPIGAFNRLSFRTAFLNLIKQSWNYSSTLSWYLVVDDYACRSLTEEKDRLPALSGIAKEIGKLSGYGYKAGLWEEDVIRGLLWSTLGSAQNVPTGEAPSWSWAAMKFSPSQIGKGRGPYHQFADMWTDETSHRQADTRILSYNIEYADGDLFGRVSRGVLTMRGRCIWAVDLIIGRPLPLYKSSNADLPSYTPAPRVTSPRDPKHVICELDHKDDWREEWSENDYCSWIESKVMYLQLTKLAGASSGIPPKLYALVLQPTGKPGEFRRRGIARIPEVDGMADKGWEAQTVTII